MERALEAGPRLEPAAPRREAAAPRPAAAASASVSSAALAAAMQGFSGPTRALPFRLAMEQRFQEDLSGVKAYTGPRARAACAALGANAFAVGDQVAFASEAPARRTVAHEVTHVVQARAGARGEGRVASEEELEAEAEAGQASTLAGAGGTLRMQRADETQSELLEWDAFWRWAVQQYLSYARNPYTGWAVEHQGEPEPIVHWLSLMLATAGRQEDLGREALEVAEQWTEAGLNPPEARSYVQVDAFNFIDRADDPDIEVFFTADVVEALQGGELSRAQLEMMWHFSQGVFSRASDRVAEHDVRRAGLDAAHGVWASAVDLVTSSPALRREAMGPLSSFGGDEVIIAQSAEDIDTLWVLSAQEGVDVDSYYGSQAYQQILSWVDGMAAQIDFAAGAMYQESISTNLVGTVCDIDPPRWLLILSGLSGGHHGVLAMDGCHDSLHAAVMPHIRRARSLAVEAEFARIHARQVLEPLEVASSDALRAQLVSGLQAYLLAQVLLMESYHEYYQASAAAGGLSGGFLEGLIRTYQGARYVSNMLAGMTGSPLIAGGMAGAFELTDTYVGVSSGVMEQNAERGVSAMLNIGLSAMLAMPQLTIVPEQGISNEVAHSIINSMVGMEVGGEARERIMTNMESNDLDFDELVEYVRRLSDDELSSEIHRASGGIPSMLEFLRFRLDALAESGAGARLAARSLASFWIAYLLILGDEEREVLLSGSYSDEHASLVEEFVEFLRDECGMPFTAHLLSVALLNLSPTLALSGLGYYQRDSNQTHYWPWETRATPHASSMLRRLEIRTMDEHGD